MKLTIKSKLPKERYEVYKRKPSTWNPSTSELTFDVNVSSSAKSWRLVHWNGKVCNLFKSEGKTWTINHLFCGTEEKCLKEIERLKLERICPDIQENKQT